MANSNILDSVEYVVENSKFVKINKSKLNEFSKGFEKHSNHYWLLDSPFGFGELDDERKAMLMAVFNAISFSYWGDPYWNVEYKGKKYTRGSWSLIACIFRAIEEERDVLDPSYLSKISKNDLAKILRGNTDIPLIEERVKILNELGSKLIIECDGKFSNLIKKAGGDAVSLLNLILKTFPSFQDHEFYKSKKVFFQKRAQALTEGIYSIFEGKGLGNLKNVEALTACADYIIPNMLRAAGILEYSEELIKKIDNKIQLKRGSPEEVEIRANTIWVVELIKRDLESRGVRVTSLNINDYLWTVGGEVKTPFHLTRTTAY